jgi:hypothetical protein
MSASQPKGAQKLSRSLARRIADLEREVAGLKKIMSEVAARGLDRKKQRRSRTTRRPAKS